MLSNRLGVTQIMMLTDQTIEELFRPGSAYLLEMDRVQLVNRALYRGLVNLYFGGFSPIGKRIGKLALGRR
jgi:hypothetical protein